MLSLGRLSRRFRSLQADATDGQKPVLAFDKDDVDTLDFVTASANLRSSIFGIEAKSKFDIKRKQIYAAVTNFRNTADSKTEMAGNIIPAIATTNAMTAAVCVLQAFKVLRDDYENAKMVCILLSCLGL